MNEKLRELKNESDNFTEVKMKIVKILGTFIFLSCFGFVALNQPHSTDHWQPYAAAMGIGGPEYWPGAQTEGKSDPTAIVGDYILSLDNSGKNCVLVYKDQRSSSRADERATLQMASPCEFIRHPKTLEPLFYSFGEIQKKNVLMIAGGPPDPELKDSLMQQGCGTELQKVIITNNELKLGEWIHGEGIYRNATHCPSGGLDEVWFGS